MSSDFDVAVLGSGFGGSLTALCLKQIGLRVALVERGRHPRFALGESSTPLANLLLRDLAARCGLPRLAPLAEYGSWREAYPQLACGLKRGFSYFMHGPGQPFQPRADHAGELLVAASTAEADADMHWFRSDFDQFLVTEVQAAGIEFWDQADVEIQSAGPPWRLLLKRPGESVALNAQLLVDAAGQASVLERRLSIPRHAEGLQTSSRSVFGHFLNVATWREQLAAAGGRTEDHLFDCDDAALHHILDGAWMWMLRFNNGVTSAGLMIDANRYPEDPAISPEVEWNAWLARYPSVARQFARAIPAESLPGLVHAPRLQRRCAVTAAAGWALLPSAAYTLDALHSTGIAHTLHGIERLAGLLGRHWGRESLPAALSQYDQILQREISLVDRLVHGCYLGFNDFRLFTAHAMFYFAAATQCEVRRRDGAREIGFLLADDAPFCRALDRAHARLQELAGSRPDEADVLRFERDVAEWIRPFNIAGLCDPTRRNMYPYLPTAPATANL